MFSASNSINGVRFNASNSKDNYYNSAKNSFPRKNKSLDFEQDKKTTDLGIRRGPPTEKDPEKDYDRG